jgi:hypothetical protein
MQFDALTAFGLLAVTAMLVFYALESRSPWFVLGFAAACARLGLRLPAGRVAVRAGGSDLGRCRAGALPQTPRGLIRR